MREPKLEKKIENEKNDASEEMKREKLVKKNTDGIGEIRKRGGD